MAPLQRVLSAVQRRLHRQRLAGYARQAAWGSVVVALLGVLVHAWVRPLEVSALLVAIALPWALAGLQSLATRPTPAECAQWADRYLDGHSGYAALLEISGAQTATPTPAVAHLEAWLEDTADRSLATLDARPLGTDLAKPLLAALVCLALAVTLLQVPTKPLATRDAATPVASTSAAQRAESAARQAARRHDAASATRAVDARDASIGSERQQARPSPTAVVPPESMAAALEQPTLETRERPPGTPSGARDPATGREAGDSVDSGHDPTLVAPWPEHLVARLREISTTREPSAGRADASRSAEFSATDAGARPGGVPLAVAAAEPPRATPALRLGPAEQGYLRTYWADTGATP